MRTFHSSELLASSPAPIQWLVDGLIQLGAGGDVSGMPGEGKSTILLSMAAAISVGRPWFGLKTSGVPAAWISGEASGADALARDLHRLKIDESDITFMLPGDVLFKWCDDEWVTTEEGRAAIARIRELKIGFMVLDTIGSLCAGLKEIDNDQQRQLARHLRAELHGITWLSISHTNQASARDDLTWRLHYLSRAGGNGFPGAVRLAAGVSRLRTYMKPNAAFETNEGDVFGIGSRDVSEKKLIAFGVSKSNETPTPVWTNHHPAFFEIRRNGELVLFKDGRECQKPVPAIQQQEVRNAVPSF